MRAMQPSTIAQVVSMALATSLWQAACARKEKLTEDNGKYALMLTRAGRRSARPCRVLLQRASIGTQWGMRSSSSTLYGSAQFVRNPQRAGEQHQRACLVRRTERDGYE